MNQFRNKIITSSDFGYLLLNWITLLIVLICFSIACIVSFENLPILLKWLFGFLLVSLSVYIPSYFYLYRVIFYSDRIEANYQVRFPSNRNKVIANNRISSIKYTYIGGRGSGGVGILKIYFADRGQAKSLKCPMDCEDAAKCCSLMKEIGIVVEIKPAWILNKYY